MGTLLVWYRLCGGRGIASPCPQSQKSCQTKSMPHAIRISRSGPSTYGALSSMARGQRPELDIPTELYRARHDTRSWHDTGPDYGLDGRYIDGLYFTPRQSTAHGGLRTLDFTSKAAEMEGTNSTTAPAKTSYAGPETCRKTENAGSIMHHSKMPTNLCRTSSLTKRLTQAD